MNPRQPVVVGARRTPFGIAGRSLAALGPAELAAPVLAALADDLKPVLADRPVDEVVLGNCRGPGGDVARVAALAAGLGPRVPGVSVDRQCGSGLEAVRLAAALVASGAADVVLAGGTESASTAPGGPQHRARFAPDGWPDPDMGPAADAVARACGVSRERQDTYAARSHALALAAREAGDFDAELVPVGTLTRDERPRPLGAATLARLRPAFGPGGTVTAGNACGINDGAAVVAVVSERVRAAAGLPGLRVLASAAVGADPALPPLAAAPAVRAVLARAGLAGSGPADPATAVLARVDRIELTEAFAAQVLACTDELGLDPLGRDGHRVCPSGGAIALGHPWAASGAFLVVRLFAGLAGRAGRAGRIGLAACAIGGGQGVAMVFEGVG
ncbi:MAG TPA: thiolase family protein [Kineosporiaceae bacterium]